MKTCPRCGSSYPTDFTLCPRDGEALALIGEWSEGTVVRGKYRILSKVGQGGMGVVYKALHVRFQELRALKVMSLEVARDATFVKRFMNEAVVTRRLQHPNAVRVDDIDEAEDGRPFLVMEYIDGTSLKDVIQKDAPLLVPRTFSIAKQVAAALDTAHRLGMVHRDVKPSNILLLNKRPSEGPSQAGDASDGAEIAKVLDFGIAQVKEIHRQTVGPHSETLTGTNTLIGTPTYMSPEQAMGKRGNELDGRSDIYSLGIVIYQMLTGDLPLKADSEVQMLMAQINTPPQPILTRRPDIPAGLAELVMRCLEKDLNRRPSSGSMLIEQIEASLRGTGKSTLEVAGISGQDAPAPNTTSGDTAVVGHEETEKQHPSVSESNPAEPRANRTKAATTALAAPESTVSARNAHVTVQASVPVSVNAPVQPKPLRPVVQRQGRWLLWAAIALAVGVVEVVGALSTHYHPVSGRRENNGPLTPTTVESHTNMGPAADTSVEAGQAALVPKTTSLEQTAAGSEAENKPSSESTLDAKRVHSPIAAAESGDAKPDVDKAIKGSQGTPRLNPSNKQVQAKPDQTSNAQPAQALLLQADQAWREGNRLLGSQDFHGADQQFRKVVSLRPDWAVGYFVLGVTQAKEGDLSQDIANQRKALDLAPNFAEPHNALGNALGAQGDWKGAIAEYRRAVQLEPDLAVAHFNLGVALARTGDLDGAIEEQRRASSLNPHFAPAHNELAYNLSRKGDWQEAIEEFWHAIRLNPGFMEAHTGLGIVLARTGNWAGAIAEEQAALRINPKWARAHFELGVALEHQGDLQAALEQYRQASELNPNEPAFRENYQRLYRPHLKQ